MHRIEGFRRSFAYDDWANRAVLHALTSDAPENCVAWLAHIVGAELLWLARLHGRPKLLPVWPQLSPSAFPPHLDDLRSAWPSFLAGLEPAGLEREIVYKNSRGEGFSSRVEDVLEHVLFHGAYHRGQIASALRAAGLEPPYTDYIHATRNGLLE